MEHMDQNSQAAADYRALGKQLRAHKPSAIVIVSAHWEASAVTVNTAPRPPMYYDYGGFPPHTFKLSYPARGDTALSARVKELVSSAGVAVKEDAVRGFDHGVFVPLLMLFPDGDVPTVELSLHASLDPALHFRIGQTLAPLIDDGVLIVGSGSNFHNFDYFFGKTGPQASVFTDWLRETMTAVTPAARAARLLAIENAPGFRLAHPREEHLTPVFVVAGVVDPTFPVPATKWSQRTPTGPGKRAAAGVAAVAVGSDGTTTAAGVADAAATSSPSTGGGVGNSGAGVAASLAPGAGRVVWHVEMGGGFPLESFAFAPPPPSVTTTAA